VAGALVWHGVYRLVLSVYRGGLVVDNTVIVPGEDALKTCSTDVGVYY
jgi:hypothetical protein